MRAGPLLLSVALALSACAAGPARTDELYGQIRVGMAPEEVRRITGAPDETMPFPLSRTSSWAWYYFDTWGYYALFSVTFAPDGRVQSTFSRRLNDGGNQP
jgi:hypothetical protein